MPQQENASSTTRTRRGYAADDIDDLLSLVSSARPQPPAPAANNDLAFVASRNDIFKRYSAYEAAIDAASAAQSGAERDVLGFTLTTRPRTEGIEAIAKQAIDMMIHDARKQFSNQYTTLSIRTSDVLAATGQEDWQQAFQQASRPRRGTAAASPALPVAAVPVDLDKIWEYLEGTYGGEAGQIALYKQLAPMLISRLHLNDKDMRRTASAVIAYQNVRTSPASFGSKTGPYTLYERRDVNEVFDALSHVFEWSGLDALSLALKPVRHQIGEHGFRFDSRDKFSFPGLDIVAFRDSWDWKFGHEPATKLQLFLGTFGT